MLLLLLLLHARILELVLVERVAIEHAIHRGVKGRGLVGGIKHSRKDAIGLMVLLHGAMYALRRQHGGSC